MKLSEVFTCLLLLDFKLITTNNENSVLDQVNDGELYTDLVFIEKNNFKKIIFWFEEEGDLFENEEGIL
jgi:hypothetical protein